MTSTQPIISICNIDIQLDYPPNLSPSPHGKTISRLLHATFRDPAPLLQRLLNRYKSPLTFKQFSYELYDQHWFSSGKQWQNVAKSVFLLFCAWREEWSALDALEKSVLCRDGFLNAGLLVFYFIYTSRIRDRNSDGLLEWDEFRVLYPSLERILQCHCEWDSSASYASKSAYKKPPTPSTTSSSSWINTDGASSASPLPHHHHQPFAEWFFQMVATDNEDEDTKCIPISRFMEVVFGTCFFASLMFHCDPDKTGHIPLEVFRNQFLQRLAPISRELQGRLERRIEQLTGIKLINNITYENILKAMIVMDVLVAHQ
eukprot:CAMPEP_0117445548 /NCGR_PEP_ID=MMETSP0759-20121206/5855_1 /TAXON_ID=63605 /ORGANISM="Percolomonas cosmopolitus, Strain WS" /LENGTH=315 /DNA_ID=CAMNT_0005237733 /DNA_START=7 /DNA_END=954 /DNA_ORIENTATION=-